MKNGSCDSHQIQKRLCLCAVHFLKWADACGLHGLVVAVSWLLPLNVFLKTEERVWTPETKGNKLYFVMQWCVLPEEAGDILFFPSYRARVLWDLYMKRFMQNLANCSGKVLCKASQHHPKTEIAGLGAALYSSSVPGNPTGASLGVYLGRPNCWVSPLIWIPPVNYTKVLSCLWGVRARDP